VWTYSVITFVYCERFGVMIHGGECPSSQLSSMWRVFDSIFHDSMINAAKRVGVPVILLKYIRRLYSGTTTRLKVGCQLSGVVHVKKGVQQNDPLSPLFFNYVMCWVLSELDTQLGAELKDNVRVNHLAFFQYEI